MIPAGTRLFPWLTGGGPGALTARLAAGVWMGGLVLLAMLALPAGARAAEHASLRVVRPFVTCAHLAHVNLGPHVKVTGTERLATPKGRFCKVLGNIQPAIGFEVDLPMEHWTQRYLQGGCGGLCGMTRVGISNAGSCAPAVNGEFAVSGTDMGHQGTMGGDGEALFGADAQKRIDFAYRAQHELARVARALIHAYYGRGPRYSYFVGCSDGGREALAEAQRFPRDFDGIAAGAPVALFSLQNSFYHAWNVLANRRADGTSILLRGRLPLLHQAVLAHCPTLSGVQDGLLADPRACRADPAWAQCPEGARDTAGCLTAEEVEVARRLYAGPADAQGHRFLIGGPEPGSEAQWMLPGTPDGTSMSAGMAARSLQYLLLPQVNPAAGDLGQFRFDPATFEQVAQLAPLYNAANTNLRSYQQRGGKLLLWHGWSDTSVTPTVSIAYYQGVLKDMGEETARKFLRLFLLPGVGHCGGGDGYSEVDLLTPLMAWTELQQAPGQLLTAKVERGIGMGMGGPPPGPPPAGPGGPARGPRPPAMAMMMASNPVASPPGHLLATRPVYPFPFIARYTGKGSPDEAASFERQESPVPSPQVFDNASARLIGPDNQQDYRVVNGQLVAN